MLMLLLLLAAVVTGISGTTIVGLLISGVLEVVAATASVLLVAKTPPELFEGAAGSPDDGKKEVEKTGFPLPVPFPFGLRPQPEEGGARGLIAGC